MKPTTTETLISKATDKNYKFFIQFGGQGNAFFNELKALYRKNPELKEFFDVCFETIQECMTAPDLDGAAFLSSHGFDLRDWLTTGEFPSLEYINQGVISLPSILITQQATYYLALQKGINQDEMLAATKGITGHSQGIISATLTSLAYSDAEYFEALSKHIKFLFFGGLRCQQVYPILEIPPEILAQSIEMDDEAPTPMASVSTNEEHLTELLHTFNQGRSPEDSVYISLRNTSKAFVLSGSKKSMVAFRAQTLSVFKDNDYKWSYLEISAPFHCELMHEGLVPFRNDLKNMNFNYKGSDLRHPVYSIETGANLQEMDNLGEYLFLSQAALPLNWKLCIESLLTDPEITHVLDFGPGRIAATYTEKHLQEKGVEVIQVAHRSGMQKLFS